MDLWEIDAQNIYTGNTRSDIEDGAPLPPHWVPETPTDPILAGQKIGQYCAGTWLELDERPELVVPAPAPGMPVLVITNVVSDSPANTLIELEKHEVTCPLGATLTFTGELRDGEGNILPLDDSFRVPIEKRGGGEGMVLATMAAGIVTVVVPINNPRDDGVWMLNEEQINSGLPPEARMQFSGFIVHVYRTA